jgi:hypothetical protein
MLGSRDSSVRIATGYEVDGQVSIPGRDKLFFSSPQRSDRSGAQPASYPMGIEICFSGSEAVEA